MTEKIDGRGWKFLNQYGATEYEGVETIDPLPRPDEKWGPWLTHPEPAEPDGKDCGAGRWHVMKKLSARYAPVGWWPWFCEYRGIIGESKEKVGVRELRLKRVSKRVFWRIIRLGWCCGADLRYANLQGADLRSANLQGADLRYADLRYADLRDADLRSANLQGADLRYADLRYADLRYANLRYADLRSANLQGADLRYADLRDADLRDADLRDADLRSADLRDADLRDANLRSIITNKYTRMPEDKETQ